MRAFEVYFNDKRLCVAGIDCDGVLSAVVNCVSRQGSEDLFTNVFGLASATDEHLSWLKERSLHTGDKIRVEIVDVATVDEPERTGTDKRRRSKEEYVRDLVKEMGWTLQTGPE